MEANILGTPAIGSLKTGIEDAISHNKTGKLVDPNNKNEILEAIFDILKNKDDFSNHAKRWAKSHNWDLIGNKYLEAIKNA